MWTAPTELPTIDEMVARTREAGVVGLERETRRVCTAIWRHLVNCLNDRDSHPANFLVLGPTGGGKSWMVRKAVEASGLMFIEENATQFSEVGFIGRDLAFMFNDFIVRYYEKGMFGAQDVIHAAERWGVVILDEFDKWRVDPNPKERQPHLSLQAELLKILEGDLILTKSHQESRTAWPIQTHHILFICLGAFEGLDKQMQKVVTSEVTDPYMHAEPADIQKYGFLLELVGRLPTIVPLPRLMSKPLVAILKQTIWPRYVQEASDAGLELVADDGALTEVAQKAIELKIGARAFESILEAILWRATSQAHNGDLIRLTPQGVLNHTPEGGGAEVIHRCNQLRIAS
jgi:ATP-dependent Clp protease ATP-binding subunit ClpX